MHQNCRRGTILERSSVCQFVGLRILDHAQFVSLLTRARHTVCQFVSLLPRAPHTARQFVSLLDLVCQVASLMRNVSIRSPEARNEIP